VKKLKTLFLITIFLLVTFQANSQNIVYANLDILINKSNVGQKIIKHFSDKNKDLNDELKKIEKKIKDQETSLISQKNILQPEEYAKKVKNLNNEIKNFNLDRITKIKKINNEREEVLKSFQTEINKILKSFAENNNIDIIMSSNQMLIGKSNLDVTNDLQKIINNKIKSFEIK
tara:strand:- start:1765 stop:2286 length:522 start_codon:yes stop_codon:yes gene_type:complete